MGVVTGCRTLDALHLAAAERSGGRSLPDRDLRPSAGAGCPVGGLHRHRLVMPAGSTDPLGAQLAAWGKVVLLEVPGRITGRPIRTAVGYVEEPDGSLLVAAGSHDADWARNLLEAGRATVEIGERRWPVTADVLAGPDANRAVRELILRYGTPAERLGAGPAFRLRPVEGGAP